MILLIGGEKGGTGKTTLATNLAVLRIREGRDVLLIDADKQKSANSWATAREEHAPEVAPRIPCIQKYGRGIVAEVKGLSERYDDIIIDAGGQDSVELRSAMLVAERMCVPIQAAQFDVWTLPQIQEVADQARALNPQLSAAIVLNRVSTNPSVSEGAEVAELLSDFPGLELFDAPLHERIAFRKAASQGLSVAELIPADAKAIKEVQAIHNLIFHEAK